MSVTKNTLLIILIIFVVGLLIYLYGGPLIDSIMTEKSKFTDWPGKNKSGWISTIFTFGLGVCTGWFLFRRVK